MGAVPAKGHRSQVTNAASSGAPNHRHINKRDQVHGVAGCRRSDRVRSHGLRQHAGRLLDQTLEGGKELGAQRPVDGPVVG